MLGIYHFERWEFILLATLFLFLVTVSTILQFDGALAQAEFALLVLFKQCLASTRNIRHTDLIVGL